MDSKTAARIESLRHAPAWDDLTQVLEEQEDRFWKAHVADVKAGKPIDQRQLDRALGKLDGIRALLAAPEKAARILLRETEKDDAA
jgi:hypothetical protein